MAPAPRLDDVSQSSTTDQPSNLEADYSPQHIRHGSSDYYFNLAQQLLVGSSPIYGQANSSGTQRVPRMAQDLQRLIQNRSGRKTGHLLSIIQVPRWLEILDTYEEEIGLLYPFLDVTELRNQLRDSSLQLADQENRQEVRLGTKLDEVLILVLAVMAVLEEPDVSTLGDEFVEQVVSGTWRRVHTGNVADHDITLSILISIYYFMTDRESLAWRNIGTVVRMLQELGYHSSSDLQHRFKSRSAKDKAKKVLWSAYTLDRRWSFGTGLPFAINDSDIDYDTDFLDESLSTAYLRAMVAYCRIGAEVRDSALGMPSPTHAKDSARDLLDFKINEWRRNLPSCLQFHQDMNFDPLTGTRGQYRLRLLLYLRANQMRIVVHRKSALRSGNEAIDTSSLNAMIEVAQDTIRVLAKLSQVSNIYHAQQKTFNHFLESALSALLLVTCRSNVLADRSCAAEVQLALDVIDHLSTTSSITRKLAEKLKCFATTSVEAEQRLRKSRSNTSSKGKSTNFGKIGHPAHRSETVEESVRGPPLATGNTDGTVTSGNGQGGLTQVMLPPSLNQENSATCQIGENPGDSYLGAAQHTFQDLGQAAGFDQMSNDTVPLLYPLESGSSEISPESIPTDVSLLDMVGGMDLQPNDRWDGLLSDLSDFWVDYDKMIAF
ncbi:hypothetical protein PFICI_15385 [Pestalotiopsis fici W106-1]|uniref:Xylanolytic transcriptional activator regulatory domain-containing protein n=1 Tax=Pestalotiopsis fici (strain W106-1 / CGMCC3.15140) TaxID=1229662 RepID=W3WGF8_PESFW|nr:uncharacterized protein PFICI_15385 [Pestalotiopsis fici W106-1]ETS72993.1 hypothetical protein PFICI_15385 [Pestalotiopsis fici W106-1]